MGMTPKNSLNNRAASRNVHEMFPSDQKDPHPAKHPKKHQAPPPTLTLNADEYLPLLDEADLDEKQKREFLQALWDILIMAADMQLGLDPIQALLGGPLAEDTDKKSEGP